MKRLPAAPGLAVAVAMAILSEVRAQAPPTTVPAVVSPILPAAIAPLPPDEFGLSPFGTSLVRFEHGLLTVVRLPDGAVLFEQRFAAEPEIGFSADDETLVVIARRHGAGAEAWIVDLASGTTTRFPLRREAQVLVSPLGLGLVIVDPAAGEVIALDDFGRPVARLRQQNGAQLGFGIASLVALQPDRFGGLQLALVELVTGRTLVRDRLPATADVGFNLFGDRLLIVAEERGALRVRLLDAFTGAPVLARRFAGAGQVGFTPFGELLVVVLQRFGRAEVEIGRASCRERV